MANTPRLTLAEVSASQSQKEVTVNGDLWTLDALVQPVVEDKDLTAPPGSPVEGKCYIVAAVASGAWTGKEKYVAQYRNAAWVFFAPFEGQTTYVADENLFYVYTGSAWALLGTVVTGADHGALAGLADDDHAQYALLAGRAGGQALVGGPGATDDLALSSTRHVVLQGAGGNVGIGVTLPAYTVSLSGAAAKTFGAERNTAAGGAGQNLTVTAGGATSGETDKAGGNLLLKSGIATGAGSSDILFYVAAASTAGTTDRTPALGMTLYGNKELRLDGYQGFNSMRPVAVTASGQGVGSFGFKTSNNTQQASFLAISEGTSDATPNVGIAFRTGGSASNKLWVDYNGNFGLGVAVGGFGSSAAKVYGIAAGTAPTSSPADIVQLWAADQAAGNCCLWWRSENGGVGKLYQLAHVADAETAHAITTPADSPASADALRDDLAANTIPAINAALNALGVKINAAYATLEALGFHATS